MPEMYTNDLIRFIYNETTTEESNAISLALKMNPTLLHEYESLKETIGQLDAAELIPHPSSIAIIMEESLKQSAEVAS